MDIKQEYERWLAYATGDKDVEEELKQMDEKQIEDAFYRDLAFGTGGLRGVIGAGTNRMNIHTVAKASQGLSDYLKKNYDAPSVVIGYDSRIKSDLFSRVAAGVFSANGVQVHIWPELLPVPTVSFATRYLKASAGVMITASHNPSKYNGYKVYGADGCQITTEAAAEILAEIEKLDIFADIKNSSFEEGMETGVIRYIPDTVYGAFIEAVKGQSVLYGEEVNKDVAIVYSPLNGSGLKPVTRTLKEMGYTNITVVKEQEQQVCDCLKETFAIISKECHVTDPDALMELETAETAAQVFDVESTNRVILALVHMPNGIQRMSPEIEGLVQTSLNLGVLQTVEDHVDFSWAVRSSSGDEKQYVLDKIISLAKLLGGSVTTQGAYPGWDYLEDSRLRKIMIEAYKEQYGEERVVEGIHAGLECGLFASKLEGLDAVSIGPQMHHIHTTEERLSISSTLRTWNLIVRTLELLK